MIIATVLVNCHVNNFQGILIILVTGTDTLAIIEHRSVDILDPRISFLFLERSFINVCVVGFDLIQCGAYALILSIMNSLAFRSIIRSLWKCSEITCDTAWKHILLY
jgi:hypothetical protein